MKFFVCEKFPKLFHLFTCILPDFWFMKLPKNFVKMYIQKCFFVKCFVAQAIKVKQRISKTCFLGKISKNGAQNGQEKAEIGRKSKPGHE